MLVNKTQLKALSKSVLNCLIEALVVVSLCTLGLCKKNNKMTDQQVLQLVLVLTTALTLVDQLAPSLSSSLRQGIGFGVGAMVVGFP